MGDDRGGHDLFEGHGLPQVGLRVERAVGVTLHRDVGDRPLQVAVGDIELRGVGGGELGEEARRRGVGEPLPDERAEARTGIREAPVTGVLEFFHADGEADVVGAGGDRVDGPPEGLGPRSAEVFGPGDGDVGEPEGHPERRRRFPHADLLDAVAEPGRFDPVLFDAGVGEALLKGLDEELLGPHIPALPEVAAPHPEYRHLILYPRCHGLFLLIVRCKPLRAFTGVTTYPPCHTGASRYPGVSMFWHWTPAFAGVTTNEKGDYPYFPLPHYPANLNSFPMSWDFMMSPSTFSFPEL